MELNVERNDPRAPLNKNIDRFDVYLNNGFSFGVPSAMQYKVIDGSHLEQLVEDNPEC